MSPRLRFPHRLRQTGVILTILLLAGCSRTPGPDPIAAEIEAFTGHRTIITWVQDTGNPGGGDYRGRGTHQRLKVFDTAEGRSRVLHHVEGMNYYMPRITREGDGVVFTNLEDNQVYFLGWNDDNPRPITDGTAQALWRSPDTGQDWIYFTRLMGDSEGENEDQATRRLFRIRVHPDADGHRREELVWRETPVHQLGVSHDGQVLATDFTWPNAGFIDLTNNRWERLATGCWPAMAPDNSYRMWVFAETHRHLTIHELRENDSWRVRIGNHPTVEGNRVFHPAWSNHPRFLAFTGPYTAQFWENRQLVNLYLARFDRDMRTVEELRIADNGVMDLMPDVWIEHGEAWERHTPGVPWDSSSAEETAIWPPAGQSLAFLWESRDARNEFSSALYEETRLGRVELRDASRYHRDGSVGLAHGWLEARIPGTTLRSRLGANPTFSLHWASRGNLPADPGEPLILVSLTGSEDTPWLSLQWVPGPHLEIVFADPDGSQRHPVPSDLLHEAAAAPSVHHWLWQIDGPHVELYLNGRPLLRKELRVPGAPPPPLRLQWGASGQSLPLKVSHLLFTLNPLDATEIEQAASATRERVLRAIGEPPPAATLRARVLTTTPTPDPGAIEPYRRALITHLYEVEEVLSGDYGQSQILVVHWGIQDGRVRPEGLRTKGDTVTMTVEPYADQPQLEGEFIADQTDEFTLEPYYQTNF